MKENLGSPNITQHVPYGKFRKNGTWIDKYGNPISDTDPDFHIKVHIPLSEISDSFLDLFFNN